MQWICTSVLDISFLKMTEEGVYSLSPEKFASCKFILPKEMYPVFLLVGKIISKNDSYKFCGLEKCKKKINFHKFCKWDLLIKNSD